MTRRVVAVLASSPRGAAPPGVDDASMCAAMLEDVVDLVAGMEQVEAALVSPAAVADVARRLIWPGMPVVTIDEGAPLATALEALHDLGADEATVVCADAPDLPPLLLGKLHSALTSAGVAVCPAEGGGLVALAARLPVADWVRDAAPRLDDPDAVAALRAAAPRRALHVGAGWHRIRTPADVARLDPGLEGWDATRALLGG